MAKQHERGGVVVAVLVTLGVGLAVAAGVRFLGQETAKTYRCQAGAVAAIGAGGGAAGCGGAAEARQSPPPSLAAPPGVQGAAEAAAAEEGLPETESLSFSRSFLKFLKAYMVGGPIGIWNFYEPNVSINLSGGLQRGPYAGLLHFGAPGDGKDLVQGAQLEFVGTNPREWALFAAATAKVMSKSAPGIGDLNERVMMNQPFTPKRLAQSLTKKMLQNKYLKELVDWFPSLLAQIASANLNAVRQLEAGGKLVVGGKMLQLAVAERAIVAEDDSIGFMTVFTLIQGKTFRERAAVIVRLRPREVPRHERALDDLSQQLDPFRDFFGIE